MTRQQEEGGQGFQTNGALERNQNKPKKDIRYARSHYEQSHTDV